MCVIAQFMDLMFDDDFSTFFNEKKNAYPIEMQKIPDKVIKIFNKFFFLLIFRLGLSSIATRG
jgi:hypothetical protein